MTPERWQRVKEIFQSALAWAPGERAAFLSSACRGDEQLRQEVESLIASAEKDGSFIDSPASENATEFLANDQELKSGQSIGRYEIRSKIGAGGMGEVYLARDTGLGRQVALKILPRDVITNPERLHRFEREAQAASALNHPNIITIHEIEKCGDTHFIVTEFIDGETLRHKLKQTQLETLAGALAASGKEAEASAIVAELNEVGLTRYVPQTPMAAVHVYQRDFDQALTRLERAGDERCVWLPYALTADPRFDGLRNEPRFRTLVRRVAAGVR